MASESSGIGSRLKHYMDLQKLTNSQFADACGIPRPSLSQLLSGRNKKISDVLVGQIHSAFPNLSVLWLMFGEGDMLLASNHGAKHMAPATPPSKSPSSPSHEENRDPEDIPVHFGQALFAEDQENVPSTPHNFENSKERAFRKPQKQPEYVIPKGLDTNFQTQELLSEIERIKKNPRKVSQITIYYDDSTFETFYPR